MPLCGLKGRVYDGVFIYEDNQKFEKWRNGLIPKEMNALGFQCKECQEING